MKKTVSLCLVVLMVCLLCLTSCEQVTAYTQLRDYLKTHGLQTIQAPGEPFIGAGAEYDPDEDRIGWIASVSSDSTEYMIMLFLDDAGGAYEFVYLERSSDAGVTQSGTGTLNANSYSGNDLIAFRTFQSTSTMYELEARRMATQLMNGLLLDMDILCHKTGLSVRDFGFEILDDRYCVAEDGTAQEDMGGAFSPARLAMAGQMVLIGMGTVFAVLAVLWLVLSIFKKAMYDAPMKKAAAKAAAEAAPPIPEPVAEATDADAGANDDANDDAIVAAITAAIAATIAEDDALSAQFADGFRVVSFRRKNDRTSGTNTWNR